MSNISNEPAFYKIYEGTIEKFTYIEWSMLSLTSIADAKDKYGGMTINLNSFEKEKIAKKCHVTISRVNHAITNLVKLNVIRRIAPSVYQFNPYMVGKGEWEDIASTREKWDKQVVFNKAKVKETVNKDVH